MTSRLVQVLTIRELLERLAHRCEAALTDGDLQSADAAYDELDALLDARIKAVQQRRPTP